MFQKEGRAGAKILRWEKLEEQRGGWSQVNEGKSARRCDLRTLEAAGRASVLTEGSGC